MEKRVGEFLLAGLAFLSTVGSSAAARAACPGDCGNDGEVTLSELIVTVNIALGTAALGDCQSVDANGDERIAIDEILGAVGAALGECVRSGARLIVASREGRLASLDLEETWTVRATADLGATVASVRCRGGRCLVVHPSPADSISVVDAFDLSVSAPIVLERGSDPRDVAFVDDVTAVVSQYGRPDLLAVDLSTRRTASIDLSGLADADGLPEALKLAACGRRVFVQLPRVDHETDAPSKIGSALAVIDLDRTGRDRVVDADPSTPGVQAIALAGRPNFDMPVDCVCGVLYIAEPEPLMQGGGGYETVDLATLTARDLAIDTGAEVGGFEVVGPSQFWLITHTDFGPGASSHLNLVGGTSSDTHNTFAGEHVNDLALDRDAGLLFFPDPCSVGPANPSCDTGVHVFHAWTGARISAQAIDPGFAPIELAVAR